MMAEAPRASRLATRAPAITPDALRTRYPDPPPRNPTRACRDYINGKLGRPPWEKVNGETSKEILDSIIARAKREPFNFNAARQQRATQGDTAQPYRVAEYIYHQPDGTPYHRVDRWFPKNKGFIQFRWTGSG